LYIINSCADLLTDVTIPDLVFNKQVNVTEGYNLIDVDLGNARGNIFQFEAALITIDTEHTSLFEEWHWCNECRPKRIFCEEIYCDNPYWFNNRGGSIQLTVDYSLNLGSYQFYYEKSFDIPDKYTITAEIVQAPTKKVSVFVTATDHKSIRLYCQRNDLKPNQNVKCFVQTTSFETDAQINVDFGDGSSIVPITTDSNNSSFLNNIKIYFLKY
jgi:hypothetical protein